MGGGASSQAEPPLPPIRRSISEAQAHVRADYDGDTLLSADVGGTGSRLHLFLPPDTTHPKESDFFVPPERMIFEKQYKNERFDSFMDVLKTFLREAGLERPPLLACLAVAGVVVDNSARFVNLGWDISGRKIEEALGIQRVELVNDFVAQGYGILTLNPKKDCQVLQDAPIKHGAPIAVIGAGTGLGEAYLAVGAQGDYEVWPSEGGHAEYAPRQEGSNSLETELLQYLLIKYSEKARVSVERVAAGRGIANIYEFLAWKYPEKVNRAVHRSFIGPIEGPRTFDPAAITKAASAGSCELSRKAVDIWAGAYGSEAGVVALTYMPFGGLYLTGGVTSKMKDWLSGKTTGQSTFLEAFLDKGRVTTMLMRVPVFVVQGEDMGERGAMLKATRIYLEQQNERRMSQASRSTGAPEFIMRPSAVTMKPGGVPDMATVQEAEEEIVSEVP